MCVSMIGMGAACAPAPARGMPAATPRKVRRFTALLYRSPAGVRFSRALLHVEISRADLGVMPGRVHGAHLGAISTRRKLIQRQLEADRDHGTPWPNQIADVHHPGILFLLTG